MQRIQEKLNGMNLTKENKPYWYVTYFIRNSKEFNDWYNKCWMKENKMKDPFGVASVKHEIFPIEGDIISVKMIARFRRSKYVGGNKRVTAVYSDHTKVFKVRVKMEMVAIE